MESGSQFDGGFQLGESLIGMAFLQQESAQIVVCFHQQRIDADGLAELLVGLLGVAKKKEVHGQIVVTFCVVGIQSQDLFPDCLGLLVFLFVFQ